LDFHSDDIVSKETAAVSMMEGQDPIQECCRFLCENQCFVVIDGLRSTHEWDLITESLLPKPVNGSIAVITQEATVAKYCVNHEEDRVMKVTYIKFDRAIGTPVKVRYSNQHILYYYLFLSLSYTTISVINRLVSGPELLTNAILVTMLVENSRRV
jgi:hypothetical protein